MPTLDGLNHAEALTAADRVLESVSEDEHAVGCRHHDMHAALERLRLAPELRAAVDRQHDGAQLTRSTALPWASTVSA